MLVLERGVVTVKPDATGSRMLVVIVVVVVVEVVSLMRLGVHISKMSWRFNGRVPLALVTTYLNWKL